MEGDVYPSHAVRHEVDGHTLRCPRYPSTFPVSLRRLEISHRCISSLGCPFVPDWRIQRSAVLPTTASNPYPFDLRRTNTFAAKAPCDARCRTNLSSKVATSEWREPTSPVDEPSRDSVTPNKADQELFRLINIKEVPSSLFASTLLPTFRTSHGPR